MALTPPDVEELNEHVKKLLEMWMRTKLVLLKAFGDEPLTADHEAAFLQLKSDISRIFRTMAAKLPSGLAFEGDKMTEMLKNAMTMEHLHTLPPSDRQKFYGSWHRVYIRLTRTLGALEMIRSGYYPHQHRELLRGPATKAKTRPSLGGK